MNKDTAPPPFTLGDDAFGDRFALDRLSLPRPGSGYAVQQLDTDTLLDRCRGDFLPVRDPALKALFDTFDAAHAAASEWIRSKGISPGEHHLAIVPAFFDERLQRHVLIYGVLRRSP